MVTGQCKGAFEHYYIGRKEENLSMVLRWRRRIAVRRPLEEEVKLVQNKVLRLRSGKTTDFPLSSYS